MLIIVNALLLVTRTIMPVLSVTTGVDIVTDGISLGMIVSNNIKSF
jgi:hypothetical protein